MKEKKITTVRLGDFVENPDNPRKISGEAFARLVEKLKRVPEGLCAMRIAYVTDHPAGRRVVLSGNTRLRALKRIRGENGEAPAAWLQDITPMTEEQRREFIVAANKSDGEWDLDRLLEQYDADELGELGLSDLIDKTLEPNGSGVAATNDEKVTEEKDVKNFVRAHFLVSVPISRVGDFVGLIEALKAKGADVDEQQN